MLITELKSKETILSLITGKAFAIVCHGCKEIHFPEHETDALLKELAADGKLTGSIVTDYICNPENLKLRLEKHTAAIEAADIVLMDDDPQKIATAIRIAKRTLTIESQNIVFALGIKGLVLILGALGIANMWAAVFADVGVSVIAILNAMRVLNIKKYQ